LYRLCLCNAFALTFTVWFKEELQIPLTAFFTLHEYARTRTQIAIVFDPHKMSNLAVTALICFFMLLKIVEIGNLDNGDSN
jgi:hypothetical protein